MGFAERFRCYIAIVIFCAFFGTIFLMIGTFGPAWFIAEWIDSARNQTMELQEGLWLARYCTHRTNDCTAGFRENVFTEIGLTASISGLTEQQWLEYRALSCISIVCAIVSLVASTVALVKSVDKKHLSGHIALLIAAHMGSVLAFISAMVPALKIAVLTHEEVHRSWSLVLVLVGTVFEFLSALFLQYAMFRTCIRQCKARKRHVRHRERDQERHQVYEHRQEHISRYLQDCNDNRIDTNGNGILKIVTDKDNITSQTSRSVSHRHQDGVCNRITGPSSLVLGLSAQDVQSSRASHLSAPSECSSSWRHTEEPPQHTTLPAYNEIFMNSNSF